MLFRDTQIDTDDKIKRTVRERIINPKQQNNLEQLYLGDVNHGKKLLRELQQYC